MNTGWAKIGSANILRGGWEKREAAALGEQCTDKFTICTGKTLLPVPGACFDRANDVKEKGVCVFIPPNEGVSKHINVTIYRCPLDRYWYYKCENKVQEKFYSAFYFDQWIIQGQCCFNNTQCFSYLWTFTAPIYLSVVTHQIGRRVLCSFL